MILAILIVACALVIADAWATKRGLLRSATESNPVRRTFIRLLGINGGTYGVAVLVCAGLITSYIYASGGPVKIVCYGFVAGLYAMVLNRNLKR